MGMTMNEVTLEQAPVVPGDGMPAGVDPPFGGLSMLALSPNEIGLLRQLASGRTNAQIGLHAHRSEKTVRNQLTHLYAKLSARNRAEAVAIYMRMGGA
jgi:DNA-binding CsgD family transcriptional regulator